MIDRRARFLIDYQDAALSDRYRERLAQVQNAEAAITKSDQLSRAVAAAYFKTLAYKDEYEVARLHANTEFLGNVRKQFGAASKLRFHLAPPLLSRGMDARGRPLKREFGAWIIPVFRVLARLKGLRGSALDVFGHSAERRMERALIGELENTIDTVLVGLDTINYDQAVSIVRRYLDIRGYGPVKEQAVREVREDIVRRLDTFAQKAAA